MNAVGTRFPRCVGGLVINGACPVCGRLSKPRTDGHTRSHDDASEWIAPLVDHRLTIADRAAQVGTYYQLAELVYRRYPWVVEARRLNRAGEPLRRAMEKAIRFDRHCRTCGGWVLRKDTSQHPACSPECAAATLVCFGCDQLKPTARFRRDTARTGGSKAMCNVCNRKQAKAWQTTHLGEFKPISEKTCPACQRTNPADKFDRSTSSRSGLQTYCKECHTQLERGVSVAQIARSHGLSYRRTRQRFEEAS